MNKTPLRSCIMCREKKDKRNLLRIVRDKELNTVFFDEKGKSNGRGAYICDCKECIEKLTITKIIENALNMNVSKENMEKVKEDVMKYLNTRRVK